MKNDDAFLREPHFDLAVAIEVVTREDAESISDRANLAHNNEVSKDWNGSNVNETGLILRNTSDFYPKGKFPRIHRHRQPPLALLFRSTSY